MQLSTDQAVQFRNRLISVLSHETKGLFANIFWLIEMLDTNLSDPSMLRQILPELQSVAQKNLEDYTDTLNWIKTQQDDFSPMVERINVFEMFDYLQLFFKQQLAVKKREIVFDGDRSIAFFSDKILVQLILKKIIENILNLSLSEKMIIFKISKSSDDQQIDIEITDNNIETDEIVMEAVTDQRTDSMTQMSEKMNIDLQFTRDIASVLNGTINTASRINNEITITLTLPFN